MYSMHPRLVTWKLFSSIHSCISWQNSLRTSLSAGVIACGILYGLTRKRFRRIFHTFVFRRTVLESPPIFNTFSSDAKPAAPSGCHHINIYPLRISCTTSLFCHKQVDPYDTWREMLLYTHNRLGARKFKNTESLLRLCQLHFEGCDASGGSQRQMALVIIIC